MADFNDSSDLLALTLLWLLAREWEDSPKEWDLVFRPLIERIAIRGRGLGPDLEVLVHSLFRYPPRKRRTRREMREVAIDVVEGYRRAADNELTKRLDSMNERLVNAERTQAQHASELHSFLWAATSGVDLKRAKLVRYVPVRIYVGNPVPKKAALEKIDNALAFLAEAMALDPAEELPAREGSWFKSLFRKTKEAVTAEEVKPVFDRTKAALEMRYLDKPQAEVTGMLADAAAKLITAFKDIEGPCCGQVGSLLIVKMPGADGKPAMAFKTLTPMELRRLEENAAMLERPADILGWLAKVSELQPDGEAPTTLPSG